MIQIVLTIHILIAAALVVVVLMQRSEGGGLGIGGGGGGGLMTGRSAANFLTRTTATLATLFFVTSLVLAILASGSSEPRSIIETTAPATNSQEPSAPLAR
ncbi:MAG: preprotein translocase subunit SecG [Rhodospirillales bacterium]|jgi:preprotein translocase subunit SecG